MQISMSKVVLATRLAVALSVLTWLAGCAGTIKQDTRVQGDVSNIQGVTRVVARMSPDAIKQQADNPQFNREELANYLRRRLEGKGLIASTATHQVDIVVTDIRVRSAVAAVMLGVLAGDDHVTGVVRVLDANSQPLRSFEVKANYALGGWGGGQDSMRMNWLYDKFSELASAELEKVIGSPKGTGGATLPAVSSAETSPPVIVPAASSLVDTGVPVADVDAVPVNEVGKQGYREWLTKQSPRAFVVADGGRANWAWGTKPKDPMQARDPVERALQLCRDQGKTGCTLYAVDNRVVYVKPAATAAR